MPRLPSQAVTQKDLEIVKELRNNSRCSLASVSRKTSLSVSTVFDKLSRLEKFLVKKHCTLIDFSALGFGIRAYYALKAKDRDELKNFLLSNQFVNTIQKTNNGTDFFVEAVFMDMKQRHYFVEALNDLGMEKLKEHFVSEDIAKENFLTKEEHLSLVNSSKF